MTETADPSSTLAGIRERVALVIAADLNRMRSAAVHAARCAAREDVPLSSLPLRRYWH